MHDELVTEIRNDHCLELIPKVKQIMINTGLESIKYGCPIEVSTAGPGPQWSK
jgi:DNA polymerase I-like protein with 3'-5' exonuclease and polymerase domains